jgi:ATP adenylyltransferase
VLTQRCERVLREAYKLEGINVGVNLGSPAGAGIEEHVHLHLVPRWNGDTNFMTVVGETRVLAEDIRSTAARLRPIFERLAALDGSALQQRKQKRSSEFWITRNYWASNATNSPL